MNDPQRPPAIRLSIAAVERDTGLSKDTLRVWERRYGFPAPLRDSLEERSYPVDQVEKLRLLKRLLDAGHRPGRVVPMPMAELAALAEAMPAAPQSHSARADAAPQDLRPLLDVIRQHDAPTLRRTLSQTLSRLGVTRFVNELVAPLNVAVGDAWMRGQLEVFEEHLYTEAVQIVLRQAIAQLPEPTAASRPHVLLTTVPGEPHGLGLLMSETLLALEGCTCVSLGVQTPLWDTIRAAQAHGSDVVAVSFTACLGPNQVLDALIELRAKLPAATEIWAGGTAPVLQRRRVEGVQPFMSLDRMPEVVRDWRVAHGLAGTLLMPPAG
jgi:MerR family transcriptional regulator, light-induced transcriptional regulator